MGRVVGGIGISHTAQVFRKRNPNAEEQNRFFQAAGEARMWLERLQPDALVVISSEHFQSFFFDHFPIYCVGMGEFSQSWGDAGMAQRTVPIAHDLAETLHRQLVEANFDVAMAYRLRLDHGFMTPLELLVPDLTIPIVPVFQNCVTPPFPSAARCWDLGATLARIIAEQRPDSERIVMVGAGGLSHWIGVPEMGQINVEFDRQFLRWVQNREAKRLQALTAEEIDRLAGNGGQEIRHWIALAGAVQAPLMTQCYVPVREWVTGMAIAHTP